MKITIDGKDTTKIHDVTNQAKAWLKDVDESGYKGTNKVRCYQHGIRQRLIWPI